MSKRISAARRTRLRWFVIAAGAAVVFGSWAMGGFRVAWAASSRAQQTAASSASSGSDKTTPSTSAQPNLVSMVVTVKDKKDKPVPDVTKDDFTLTEDGKPQTIQLFAKAVSQPLILGLLVDTGASERSAVAQERSPSRSFLDQIVREEMDKGFVIHFDREVELLQDLTSSHQKLENAMNLLEAPQLARSGGSSGGGNPGTDDDSGQGPSGGRGQGRGMHSGGGAQLYDAVYLASNELMKKQTGRKVLVVLSDGVDRGSKETLENALESAQRTSSIIYTIYVKGSEGNESGGNRGGFGVPGMGGPMGGGMGRHGGRRYPQPQESHVDGKKILERLSAETGGQFFEVTKKLSMEQVYAEIEQSVRNQYTLNYAPLRAEGSGGEYHKIQLASKKKDVVVQVREGYYTEGAR